MTQTTPSHSQAVEAAAKLSDFDRWFMLQSKMHLATPETIAYNAWHAAIARTAPAGTVPLSQPQESCPGCITGKLHRCLLQGKNRVLAAKVCDNCKIELFGEEQSEYNLNSAEQKRDQGNLAVADSGGVQGVEPADETYEDPLCDCGQSQYKPHSCAYQNGHDIYAKTAQPTTPVPGGPVAQGEAVIRFNGDRASASAIATWANAFPEIDEGEPNCSYITTDGSDAVDDLLLAMGDENRPVRVGDYVTRLDSEFIILRFCPMGLDEADELLTALNLDPNTYRTDGGWLNLPKIKAAITNPADYPRTPANMAVGAVGEVYDGVTTHPEFGAGAVGGVGAMDFRQKVASIERSFDHVDGTTFQTPWVKVEFLPNDWMSRDFFADWLATPAPEQATTGSGQDSSSDHLVGGECLSRLKFLRQVITKGLIGLDRSEALRMIEWLEIDLVPCAGGGVTQQLVKAFDMLHRCSVMLDRWFLKYSGNPPPSGSETLATDLARFIGHQGVLAAHGAAAKAPRPDATTSQINHGSAPVTDSRCNYVTPKGGICFKCGQAHDGGSAPRGDGHGS